MNLTKLLGAAVAAAAGYGIYRVLKPTLALAGIGQVEPQEGVDYETITGLGVPKTALEQIKAKEYQLRQMPDQVASFMRTQQDYITKNTQTTVPPAHEGHFYGNGLSDKQRNQIAQAGLRYAFEQTRKSGKVINSLGRPE